MASRGECNDGQQNSRTTSARGRRGGSKAGRSAGRVTSTTSVSNTGPLLPPPYWEGGLAVNQISPRTAQSCPPQPEQQQGSLPPRQQQQLPNPVQPEVPGGSQAEEHELDASNHEMSEASNASCNHLSQRSFLIQKGPKIKIHDLLAGHFKGPWTCWSKIPKDVRNKLYYAWKGKYTWDPEDEKFFYKSFKADCSKWLRTNLYNARNRYKAPFAWITPELWEQMRQQWASEDFQQKSAQNKKNRESSGDNSTIVWHGGSVSAAVHEMRLAEELGRKPTPSETFVRTHKDKKGQLDPASQQMVDEYQSAFEKEIESGKEESSINQESLWMAKFPPKKGRIRGRGNLAYLDSDPYAATSSEALSNQKTQQLEAKVEVLTQELEKSRSENASNAAVLNCLIATLASQGIDVTQVVNKAAPVAPQQNSMASQSNALHKRAREAAENGEQENDVEEEEEEDEGETSLPNPNE